MKSILGKLAVVLLILKVNSCFAISGVGLPAESVDDHDAIRNNLAFLYTKVIVRKVINGVQTADPPARVDRFCGGIILNDHYMLTALHCLIGKSLDELSGNDRYFLVTQIDVSLPSKRENPEASLYFDYKMIPPNAKEVSSQVITYTDIVDNAYVPPPNQSLGFYPDLVLLEFHYPLPGGLEAITVPAADEINLSDTANTYAYGWGADVFAKQDGKNLKSNIVGEKGILRKTKVGLLLRYHYPPTLQSSFTSAGGDSGGPVLKKNALSQYLLLGINSTKIAVNSAHNHDGTELVDLGHYANWINLILAAKIPDGTKVCDLTKPFVLPSAFK